jgi:CheY-like chemotaxis protein
MPHALIVDDSKTARYALRNLLDKQQFTADMVESAEQALEYLQDRLPDLIFMDHMMPGMDGFQAVKAIKSHSTTANIPIVMYTSTQGKVYFGQARALGAADVMTKPASAEDLVAMLARLEEQHLLGQSKTEPASEPVAARPSNNAHTQNVVELPSHRHDEPAHAPQPVAPQVPHPAITVSNELRRRAPNWAPWIVVGWVFGVLGVALMYFNAEQQRHLLANQHQRAIKAIEWAFNLNQQFAYGEVPFGGERLERLQELVQQLHEAGFRGTLRLESHVGEFCLLRLPAGDGKAALWVPAPSESHLTDCNVLGQSSEQSQQLAAAQSSAFGRFLQELPAGIHVQTVPLGAAEPIENYPTDPDALVGEWNRVAQRNQRLRLTLLPSTSRHM